MYFIWIFLSLSNILRLLFHNIYNIHRTFRAVTHSFMHHPVSCFYSYAACFNLYHNTVLLPPFIVIHLSTAYTGFLVYFLHTAFNFLYIHLQLQPPLLYLYTINLLFYIITYIPYTCNHSSIQKDILFHIYNFPTCSAFLQFLVPSPFSGC